MKWLVAISLTFILGFSIQTKREPTFKFATKVSPAKAPVPPPKPLIVAVIDTGFGYHETGYDVKLCKYGHKDFTNTGTTNIFGTADEVPVDNHGHGTHVAGVINSYAQASNYCIVVLKYFDPSFKGSTSDATLQAIKYAINIKADFINYSGGGADYNPEEAQAVKKFLDQGGTFVAAAGNENQDLDKHPFYPAMDDPRTIVVGNLYTDGVTKAPTSNYGKPVTRWEIGTSIKMYDMILSGTSQAAAVATGKIISTK